MLTKWLPKQCHPEAEQQTVESRLVIAVWVLSLYCYAQTHCAQL